MSSVLRGLVDYVQLGSVSNSQDEKRNQFLFDLYSLGDIYFPGFLL